VARRIVECVPNFSEGRDASAVDAIADAVASTPGAFLLARESDPDHNRSVITFAGTPEGVAAAAVRAIEQAVLRIDLTRHEGVHPRIGAADVVPFVPIEGVTLEECVALAHEVGREVWRLLRVPVYFYEAAALVPERQRLENIRRGGLEYLRRRAEQRPPDIGGPQLHPTAGATIIGARKFLIAFNANLTTADDRIARAIARKIRESSGGLPALKAIGAPLASRGMAQVAMNLTDFETTGMFEAYEAVRKAAAEHGAGVATTEIVGLVPRRAVEQAAARFLSCENLTADRVLEDRLEAAAPSRPFDEVLERLASAASPMGGGSAAALAGSMAAALGCYVARARSLDPQVFLECRAFLAEAAGRDAAAFNEVLIAARAEQPARTEMLEKARKEAALVAAEITEYARRLDRDLQALMKSAPSKFRSDLTTALALSRAARAGAIATARSNLQAIEDARFREEIEARINRTVK
jgi:glutamate formiminotransferase